MAKRAKIGTILWRDLTVPDAAAIKDFYCDVVGWKAEVHDGCDDFNILTPAEGECVAGICYAKGNNANLPPQWLIYITVENVAESAQKCVERGGKLVDGPRQMGNHYFCVIQDPAGAVAALIEG
ncbi:MAG: VOC family protein [Gemmatimonadetes bacterium]|nr:MAG: VOC family protein [Gemmatimonadota bacterium]